MATEKIKIKSTKNVSVGRFFTNLDASSEVITSLNDNNIRTPWKIIKEKGVLGFGLKGADGVIVELLDSSEGQPARRSEDNNSFKFLSDNELTLVTTGLTYDFYYNRELAGDSKQLLSENLKNETYAVSGSAGYSYLFFTERPIEDYNLDITINRTFDTLDTLGVKNNPLSKTPGQDSQFGVLVGTLYATQKIIDENGDRVRIPLSNVPVAIFNPSEELPQISSTDINGNRITLNLLENSNFDDYTNLESFVLDVGKVNADKELEKDVGTRFSGMKPLLKEDTNREIPEKYKYSTMTNDKGEFILQNVPTGPQTLMFEVDLLKKGMTKEEVALNFFPYPADSEPNVDSVPHYFFRQIPINIVPAWGDFQTGYTQVEVNVSVDMRKWSTFFVSPMSAFGKDMTELLQAGYFDALTILARDMARPDYPLVSEIVEIRDIYNRNPQERVGWYGEFKAQKPKIEFRSKNFQAFKLPANLYDPEGKTSQDSDRKNIKENRGTWLSSYQIKMYYGKFSDVFRATGFVRKDLFGKTPKASNHFDLNRGRGFDPNSATGADAESSLGTFPYEKPWTINYPEPYSIPKRPVKANETKNFDTRVEPRYLDGDLVGDFANESSEDANGYGTMRGLENSTLINNRFSQTVTKAKIYKYEKNVSWHEEFSNGYRKQWHASKFPGKTFEVVSGEKYQRVEAGFSYWIKPEGWGRINNEPWGDLMNSTDINASSQELLPSSYIPPTYSEVMNRKGEEISILLDSEVEPQWLRVGGLDLYRVIDDSTESLLPPGPPFVEKITKVFLGNMWKNRKSTSQKLQFSSGSEKSKVSPISAAEVVIKNRGSVVSSPTAGGVKQRLEPGESKTFSIFSGAEMILPANFGYDVIGNFYEQAQYEFIFKNSEVENAGTIEMSTRIGALSGPVSDPVLHYLVSRYTQAKGNVKIKIKKDGDGNEYEEITCKNNFQQTGTYDVNGLVFERTDSFVETIYFAPSELRGDCTTDGVEIRRLDDRG